MKVSKRNVFHCLVGIILRHPFSVLLVGVLGVVLSLLLTGTYLGFHTNRLDLFSAGSRYKELDEAYDREFTNLPEGVIVVIRSESPETAKAFATALARRWETDPNIDQVLYRITADALKNKALLYLSPDELMRLREKLEQHHALLKELEASPTLQDLFALINREITTTLVSHVFTGFLEEDQQKEEPPDLSLLLALLQQMNQWLDGHHVYRSPWATFFTKDDGIASRDGFLWSDDHKLLFVLVQPRREVGEFSSFEKAVQQVRADAKALQKAYPGVEVGVTGRSVLDADEMGIAQRDTSLATVISVVGVTLLYFGLFRGVVRPLLALATLLIAVCWSLGFTTLTIGHLNILTIVFMPMLMGLGIDYGSYFIARYEEERGTGQGVREALTETFLAIGPGIAVTSLTTAFAFGTLCLTGFKGIAELGFIGGSGILLAGLATFTMLPTLLVVHERRRPVRVAPHRRVDGDVGDGYLKPFYRYPWATIAASALVMGLSLLALGEVGSDFNLLHLQAKGAESVRWTQRLFESTKRSVLYGEIVVDSLEEVKRKASVLRSLPSVAEVDSITSVIPEDQARKLPLIKELRPFLADISFQGNKAEAVDLDALRSTLERIGFKMGDEGAAAGDPEEGSIRQQMQEVRRLIGQFSETSARMQEADVRQTLFTFQEEVGRDLEEKLAVLKANLKAEPVTIADLPAELRTRYIGKTGKYRLFIYPSEDIWEPQPLARFVKDLRAVDPDVLGTPVTNFEFTHGIKEAYQQAGLYAFLGISFLALLTFRAMSPALLALTPLAVGSVWTLGFMGLFEVKFNVANLIVLPLIVAPAVESGIMIVYRYREERRTSGRPMPLPASTGRAVIFSSLSTIVGFGSLMISHHQGILSIGLLLTCGVSSVLLASLTVLPSLLALLSSRGGEWALVAARRDELSKLVQFVGMRLLGQVGHSRGSQLPFRKLASREAVGAGATFAAGQNGRRGGEL
jgi:uncharacterized protein